MLLRSLIKRGLKSNRSGGNMEIISDLLRSEMLFQFLSTSLMALLGGQFHCGEEWVEGEKAKVTQK